MWQMCCAAHLWLTQCMVQYSVANLADLSSSLAIFEKNCFVLWAIQRAKIYFVFSQKVLKKWSSIPKKIFLSLARGGSDPKVIIITFLKPSLLRLNKHKSNANKNHKRIYFLFFEQCPELFQINFAVFVSIKICKQSCSIVRRNWSKLCTKMNILE